ncbi:hypothetical protein PPACK8108_LOCUS14727 [Phakopsora pachyrhizi]|uniref:Uncharacterized protein n=1 Tax=Phakopsora pachyrhizi TaxID=170000 RepID=A0AAV0B4Z5_PHAPC|nr:hypothetical protein PPACK8108_LOCUS14727 [Phakopsora pachyrhizi]
MIGSSLICLMICVDWNELIWMESQRRQKSGVKGGGGSEEKILDEALVFCSRLERLGLSDGRLDLSWRDLRLELELAESRARALKRKQAGLLPLPEDEDEGDRSDKTPLLKQSTGDEKGSQHRTEEVDILEKALRYNNKKTT